ncbi:hypothetical protein F4779DRAFT_620828 [Xylariaceae sp. FL0662B]|nr:hypothetical protein F4779DRAFT_620828 [Xylariaceae sp. FL0662B]
MKSIAAIASLFLVAVSAAPVEQRQTPTEFDITKFSANTKPHGDGAFISFDIAIPSVKSTTCSYADTTSVSQLPAVSMRPCDDAAFEWQFRQDPSQPGAQGRYRVVVTYAVNGVGDGRKVAGYHEWPATDFPLENFGSTVETFYRGEPDFVIDDLVG